MCATKLDVDAKFCSNCGSDLVVNSKEEEVFRFDGDSAYSSNWGAGAEKRNISNMSSQAKKGLYISASVVVGLFLIGQIISLAMPSSLAQNTQRQSEQISIQQPEVARTDAIFYDSKTVPFFTGYSASSAVVIMRDEFDERFWSIENLDTGRDISTYFSRDKDLEDLEGLFVCSQNYAPGIDPSSTAFQRLKIEISSDCLGESPRLAFGPAAEQMSLPVLQGINGECYQTDRCDLNEMDGIFLGFVDDGYLGHKTGRVLTGLGEMEIELALVDLSSEWCQADESMMVAAISARDEILREGEYVRLKGAEYFYGDRRMVHRLDIEGRSIDGTPPENSVNELLVKTGLWVPDDKAGEHPWERVRFFDKEMISPSWSNEKVENSQGEIAIYINRILDAANETFSDPVPQLASCLNDKDDAVVVLIAEEEERLDEESRERRNRTDDVEAVWRSVFCPTFSEKHPERCSAYNPEVDDKVGVGGGGSIGGIGSNCTWVDGHYRGGSFVRGHMRCY